MWLSYSYEHTRTCMYIYVWVGLILSSWPQKSTLFVNQHITLARAHTQLLSARFKLNCIRRQPKTKKNNNNIVNQKKHIQLKANQRNAALSHATLSFFIYLFARRSFVSSLIQLFIPTCITSFQQCLTSSGGRLVAQSMKTDVF